MIEPDNLIKFKKILKNYQPSKEAVSIIKQLNFCILLGPSASGKNTIIQQLLKSSDYHFIVSDTTRNKRMNDGKLEVNGQNYWFISEETMLQDLTKGLYLEAEIIHSQQVSGISLRELEETMKLDKIALADMDIGGVEKLLNIDQSLKVFLIIPPSFEVWLKRLKARDEIENTEIKRRLETSLKIYNSVKKLNTVEIINDDYMVAAKTIDEIIKGKIKTGSSKKSVDELVSSLIEKTEDYLANLS